MTALPPDVVPDLGQENARLQAELRAMRDRQAASAEILRTIASASGDAGRSLQQIAETSARLFGAPSVSIQLVEGAEWGQAYRFGASALRIRAAVPLATIRVGGPNMPGAVVTQNRQIHIPDLDRVDPSMADWPGLPHARAAGTRVMAGTPLRREGKAIGVLIIYRDRLAPFTAEELALQQSFADQAVIAIENARLFNEVQARTNELTEALEQQTATSEVLSVISRSAGDLAPVFDAMLGKAMELCSANFGVLNTYDGKLFHTGATYGLPPDYDEYRRKQPLDYGPGTAPARLLQGEAFVEIDDLLDSDAYRNGDPNRRALVDIGGASCLLAVPLLKDDRVVGNVMIFRQEKRPFSEKQITLLKQFAAQAVIAIENTRLLHELRQSTDDLTEALTYQTGSANILSVIASSPTDVAPVLKAIVGSACELCGAYDAVVMLKDGDELRLGAHHGPISMSRQRWPSDRTSISGRAMADRRPVHVEDVLSDEGAEFIVAREMSRVDECHTLLGAPLLREGESIGAIVLRRSEVLPFSEKQIALLQTFADQAVIALGNVRLFEEVQAKTRDLEQALKYQTGSANILNVIASSPTDVQPVLKAIVESACELCSAYDAVVRLKSGDDLEFSAHHGPLPVSLASVPITENSTAGAAVIGRKPVHVHDLHSFDGDRFPHAQELARMHGERTILSVPLLREGESIGAIILRRTEVHPFSENQIALLQTFADQAVIAIGNTRLFDEVQARTGELAKSLEELRTAQDRLIQTEKLASLGQLTAGIAHEIKNPLNFVNNFSALSVELTDELNELLRQTELSDKLRAEVDELTGLLKDNLEKVVQHGKRADSIVKNMLLHSRDGAGEHRPADINALIDESLNLAYHGARAEKPQFNVTLQRSFDPEAGMVEVFPQEITRVFLNLIANGFYAVTKRKTENGAGFDPVVSATTKDRGAEVEIRIRDNGTGIPPEVKEKMFNPFFTTKPAGEGTGLGLSMSHDIIVKQHGGTIDVDTEPGAFTEFRIVLPRTRNLPNK
jgi:signal transduction histidine kinase/putative methionine-R-sulfoxide reductase with GAF domain